MRSRAERSAPDRVQVAGVVEGSLLAVLDGANDAGGPAKSILGFEDAEADLTADRVGGGVLQREFEAVDFLAGLADLAAGTILDRSGQPRLLRAGDVTAEEIAVGLDGVDAAALRGDGGE